MGTSMSSTGVLLQQDGKIDESCFTDGLHPNEKGYGLIVEQITQ